MQDSELEMQELLLSAFPSLALYIESIAQGSSSSHAEEVATQQGTGLDADLIWDEVVDLEEEPQGADQVEEAPTTVIPVLDEGFRAALASSKARARSRSRSRTPPWKKDRLYCFNCMYINIIYGFWRTVHESTFSGVDRGPCHP